MPKIPPFNKRRLHRQVKQSPKRFKNTVLAIRTTTYTTTKKSYGKAKEKVLYYSPTTVRKEVKKGNVIIRTKIQYVNITDPKLIGSEAFKALVKKRIKKEQTPFRKARKKGQSFTANVQLLTNLPKTKAARVRVRPRITGKVSKAANAPAVAKVVGRGKAKHERKGKNLEYALLDSLNALLSQLVEMMEYGFVKPHSKKKQRAYFKGKRARSGYQNIRNEKHLTSDEDEE